MYGRKWHEDELKILRDCYPIGGRRYTQNVLAAEGFSRTLLAIKSKAQAIKIQSGHDGKFKKGQRPINQWAVMDTKSREKIKATWFQKGHLPHNTKHDGAITCRNGYYWIRISLGKWEQLHRHLWKKTHGPIPKGMLITFKDQDSMNCVLENLEMISKKENLRRRHEECGGHAGELLTDGYVRSVLIRRGVDPEVITPAMIETKRLQLILNREIKKNETGN